MTTGTNDEKTAGLLANAAGRSDDLESGRQAGASSAAVLPAASDSSRNIEVAVIAAEINSRARSNRLAKRLYLLVLILALAALALDGLKEKRGSSIIEPTEQFVEALSCFALLFGCMSNAEAASGYRINADATSAFPRFIKSFWFVGLLGAGVGVVSSKYFSAQIGLEAGLAVAGLAALAVNSKYPCNPRDQFDLAVNDQTSLPAPGAP